MGEISCRFGYTWSRYGRDTTWCRAGSLRWLCGGVLVTYIDDDRLSGNTSCCVVNEAHSPGGALIDTSGAPRYHAVHAQDYLLLIKMTATLASLLVIVLVAFECSSSHQRCV